MKVFITGMVLACSIVACDDGTRSPSVTNQSAAASVCTQLNPSLAIQRLKIPNWFHGGIAGKKIVWIGDSTTEKMGPEAQFGWDGVKAKIKNRLLGGISLIKTGGSTNQKTSPVAQFGWDGVNDYYIKRYANQVGQPLYGTTQVWLGSSGNTLTNFLANQPSSKGISSAIAAGGDIYILSYGINDVRLGGTDQEKLTSNLKFAVNAIRAALPNRSVILRMPNSLLAADVNAHGWVVPNSSAQVYTDILRNAYRSLANEWPDVIVYDSQTLLFTEISSASNPYMVDQLHPNAEGYAKIYDQLVEILGQPTPPTCP